MYITIDEHVIEYNKNCACITNFFCYDMYKHNFGYCRREKDRSVSEIPWLKWEEMKRYVMPIHQYCLASLGANQVED